ncbi:MAG: protein-disulfide reductase DsbD domain-containing protein [Ignavibacteriota bacterium]
MRNIKTIIYFLFAAMLFAQISITAQQKSLAEANLVVDSYSPQNDSVISIGVLINLKDDWHIYWKNPGDSGLPTDVEFSLPNGISASEIKFPIPKIFSSEEIINYGYSHQVLLISSLNIPKDYPQKDIFISAKLTSLICKDLCKAFDTTLTILLDLSKKYFAGKEISDLFNKTKKLLPQINYNLKVTANSQSDSVYVRLDKTDSLRLNLKSFEFYPYQAGVFKNKSHQVTVNKNNFLESVLESDQFRISNPTELNGIIILNENRDEAFEINIPITY